MWRSKVWIEGKWLWFTSTKETEDDAIIDIFEQARQFFKDWYRNEDVDEAMFFFEELERIDE